MNTGGGKGVNINLGIQCKHNDEMKHFTNPTLYKDNSQTHETSALDWRFPHLGRVLEVPSGLGGVCYIAVLLFTQQKCLAIYGHVASVDGMYFCFI